MRTSRFFAAAGLVLACTLALAGCPGEADAKPDSRLINTWANGDASTLSGLYKTFTINSDYTFTAKINPPFIMLIRSIKASEGFSGGDTEAITAAKQQLGQGNGNADVIIAGMEWTVTGKLTIDNGEIYVMSALKETSNKPADPNTPTGATADSMVSGFNGELVELKFNSNTAFTFKSAGTTEDVTTYFGGTYNKVP
jgi:hypothetical protein